MTGLDVLRACERYDTDMRRLQLSYDIAMDAATRVTPRYGADTGGGGSAAGSAQERFALRAAQVSRRMDARRAMYAQELAEASRLLGEMEAATADVLYRRMIAGRTVKEIATEDDCTIDSVRGRLSRGRALLAGMSSALDADWTYQEQDARYRQRPPVDK